MSNPNGSGEGGLIGVPWNSKDQAGPRHEQALRAGESSELKDCSSITGPILTGNVFPYTEESRPGFQAGLVEIPECFRNTDIAPDVAMLKGLVEQQPSAIDSRYADLTEKLNRPKIDPKIFNADKADYGKRQSLFMGEDPGLFDTVHLAHPQLRTIFREQKKLDWDENEVPFDSCNLEFKTRPSLLAGRMIDTLAWQWEADSVAARSMYAVMAPFITNSELSRAWVKVTEIEHLHAATYSEIVRSSFDDPEAVLSQVLSNVEALQRMSVVGDVLKNSYRISHELALGMRTREQDETYDAAMMATVAFLALERVQFMSSFAITFANANQGMWVPIGKAVSRICQDEYEIHVELDKYVLNYELSLPCGKAFMERNRDLIKRLFDDVIQCEFRWIEYMGFEQNPMVGLNAQMLKDWVVYCAADAMAVLGLKPEYPVSRLSPLPYMEEWIDVSKIQSSPQEEKGRVQYKNNVLIDDLGDAVVAVDF